MTILDLLRPEAVKVPLESDDKRDAIDELVDLLAENGVVGDPEELKRVVWDREMQRSTGIGEGLAIPHAKTASIDELVMAVGVPKQPMDFDSIDRKPVRMIVLLGSPANRTADHIQALGRISRLMNNPEFRDRAYATDDAAQLYELLSGADA